jgi:hypothetical protein
MLCMSSAERGTFWANIPEEALTTLELDHRQLRQLLGPAFAMEYMRCHDPIVRPGYWVQPFQDPWLVPDVRRGYWHTSHVWRVQYWLGRYVRNHEPIPAPTPFQKFQAACSSRC